MQLFNNFVDTQSYIFIIEYYVYEAVCDTLVPFSYSRSTVQTIFLILPTRSFTFSDRYKTVLPPYSPKSKLCIILPRVIQNHMTLCFQPALSTLYKSQPITYLRSDC